MSEGVIDTMVKPFSVDGNTAVVGEPFDNAEARASWNFTRSSGVWAQQGGLSEGRCRPRRFRLNVSAGVCYNDPR
jgi:hypothetical protein